MIHDNFDMSNYPQIIEVVNNEQRDGSLRKEMVEVEIDL
jgi:hypothetical protein